MNMTCNKRLKIRTLSISMAGIVWCAFAAGAAVGPYDLDLKELRRPPVHPAKDQAPPKAIRESVPAPPIAGKETSSYTVRPGDHLFRILMQHYGLSNSAAERLIPEIMRLNGIRSPKSLFVGQRLTIPLPPVTDAAAKTSSEGGQKTPISPPPETAAAPPHATEPYRVQEITADRSLPCRLVREVAEQLGAQVSALPPFIKADGASISYDALKVTVTCGLEPAEEYTLKRLLTPQGGRLLLFKADEAPRTVIEGMAGTLGFSFRLTSPATAADLPLTYLFPAAIAGKDLRLTVSPVAPASK